MSGPEPAPPDPNASGRIARSAGLLTVAKAGTMALNLVTWAYLARVLGPELYGQIGVGLAFVGYFSFVVALGFDTIGMREVARDPSQAGRLVAEIVSLRAVLCAVALALYAVAVWALPRPPGYRLVLAVLGAQLVGRALQIDWLFVATDRAGAVAARELGTAVLLVVGVLSVVRTGGDVVWAAAFVAGAPVLSAAALWVRYAREHGQPRFHISRGAWAAIVRPALPLAASALMLEVYTSLDRLMLDALRSTEEAGLYTAAYKLFYLAVVPTAILYPAFFGPLAHALGDADAMRRRGRQLGRAMIAFGIPVALAGPFLADGAVVLINGAAYAGAGAALAVLFVTAGVVHVNASLGTPLMAWDLQTPYMWAVVAGAVANVMLNVALIPSFGAEGAAAATLASEVVVGLGLAALYRRATGTLPFGDVGRVVVASVTGALPPVLLGTWLGWPVLASAAAALAGYALAAWVTGVVDRDWVRDGLRARFATPPADGA